MPKLIILDGPDGVGKSTQVKKLTERYKARTIIQPSHDNSVGFLRPVVKEDPSWLPFERQLLHGVTHIVDVYEKMQGDENLVMDRCYLSGWVYGSIMGLSDSQIELLLKMQREVHATVRDKYDVSVVILNRSQRLNTKDDSHYEKLLKWEEIQKSYLEKVKSLDDTGSFLISPDETRTVLNLKESDQIEETFNAIIDVVEGGNA